MVWRGEYRICTCDRTAAIDLKVLVKVSGLPPCYHRGHPFMNAGTPLKCYAVVRAHLTGHWLSMYMAEDVTEQGGRSEMVVVSGSVMDGEGEVGF